MLLSQSARSSINMTENKEEKRKQQDKGDVEWLNERYAGKEGGKRNDTPMLAHAETHYHGCCQHRCWTEGELSVSVCVCVCVSMRVYVCVRMCDSVWQWSEGYLAMTAADTMGPFLYLSIQCSLSPPSHLSSCSPPPPSHFFKSSPPLFLLFIPF